MNSYKQLGETISLNESEFDCPECNKKQLLVIADNGVEWCRLCGTTVFKEITNKNGGLKVTRYWKTPLIKKTKEQLIIDFKTPI